MSRRHFAPPSTSAALRVAGVCALLALAACRPSPEAVSSASRDTSEGGASTAARKPDQGKNRMSALNGLLLVFAGDAGTAWSAYDHVAEVQWRQAEPVETPEVADPDLRFSRSGRLRLAGFGEVDLPDGETGVDAGLSRGNEGDSGVTLNGSADRVNEIAVVKFYPSDDYPAVLRGQFPDAAKIVLEADCPDDDDGQQTRFYRIDLDGATFAHVEAFVDQDAGPGSTTFVFTRSRPERRIAELKCREVSRS
jgi:hypothetical protein